MAFIHIATSKGHGLDSFEQVEEKVGPRESIDGLLRCGAGPGALGRASRVRIPRRPGGSSACWPVPPLIPTWTERDGSCNPGAIHRAWVAKTSPTTHPLGVLPLLAAP
jgi:hypothetical protein